MKKIITFLAVVLAISVAGCTHWSPSKANVVKTVQAHLDVEQPAPPAVDSQLAEIGDFLSNSNNKGLFDHYRVDRDSGAIVVDFVQNRQNFTVFYTGRDTHPAITFYVKPVGTRKKADSFSSYLDGTLIRGIYGDAPLEDSEKTTEQNMQFREKTDFQTGIGEMYREVWQLRFNQAVDDTLQFIDAHKRQEKKVIPFAGGKNKVQKSLTRSSFLFQIFT